MIKKLSTCLLLGIAFIGILLIHHQESFADTLEETPITTNQENLVPDAEVAEQLNNFGRWWISDWPAYIEMTQEKFDLINQFEGNKTVTILLTNDSARSLEGLQYLQPKCEVWIAIAGKEIEDLSPLEQIGNLVHLELVKPNISPSNFEVISKLTKLNILTIETDTNIDLNLIANMLDLKNFQLQGISKRIELLPPTATFDLPKLESLLILYANLSDVSFVGERMHALKQLVLISLPITNIDNFVNLSQLESLILFDTFVGSYPVELATFIQTGAGNLGNGNNWYEGEFQNTLAPIEAKDMLKNEKLQLDVSLNIQDTSEFINVMKQQGMELLTDSNLFQAEITSSDPAIVSVDPTSTVNQISLSSHHRSGTVMITYKLPSNTEISFAVTVHGDGIPPVVQGKNVVYEQGIIKSEADYLKDANIVSDKESTITTDFDQVVNLNHAGDYMVTVYATDEDGVQSQNIQLTVTVESKKVDSSKATPDQSETVIPDHLEEQQKNEENTLPKTASTDNQSFLVVGSLLALGSLYFILKKRLLLNDY